MTRVLVIEDDPAILLGLTDNLAFEGYEVLGAPDGETGDLLQQARNPDLIVLDLMLPKMSGLELCRSLRSRGIQTPILVLTARSEEADRVLGLDTGADDYLTKPFSLKELMARIRALLRRTRAASELPFELRFDDVAVDFLRYVALRDGKNVEMTRKEFDALRFLAGHAGKVVTRDQLLKEVWGYDSSPISRTVDNHVAGLRSKLERVPAHPEHIRTVHGVGYKFVP